MGQTVEIGKTCVDRSAFLMKAVYPRFIWKSQEKHRRCKNASPVTASAFRPMLRCLSEESPSNSWPFQHDKCKRRKRFKRAGAVDRPFFAWGYKHPPPTIGWAFSGFFDHSNDAALWKMTKSGWGGRSRVYGLANSNLKSRILVERTWQGELAVVN